MLENWVEQLRRGTLEMAVLLTVALRPRYGLEIIRHLEAVTDLVLTEGTVYPLLARLARDGFLTAGSRMKAASAQVLPPDAVRSQPSQ